MNKNDNNSTLYGLTSDLAKSFSKRNSYDRDYTLLGMSNLAKLMKEDSIYQRNLGLNSKLGLSAFQNIHKWFDEEKPKLSPFSFLSGQLSQVIQEQEKSSKYLSPLTSLNLPETYLQKISIIKEKSIPDISIAYSRMFSLEKQESVSSNLQKYITYSFDNYVRQYEDKTDFDDVIKSVEEITSVVSGKIETELILEKIKELNNKLTKADTTSFIHFIIQVLLALMLAFSNTNPDQVNNFNIQINNEEKKDIETELMKSMKIICIEQRKAIKNVDLRTKPSTNSGKIGVIPKDQIVLIQNINKKWIYVVFQDENYILKAGWAYKKYFKQF